jgi:nucleotide-binding universal stress UspA family protein
MKEVPIVNGDEAIKELRQMQDRGQLTGGHQRNPTALKHILAPTDLTLDAQKAVDYAVALARNFGARLTLLHVYNSDFNCDYVLGTNDYSDEDRYRGKAEKALRQLCVDYREEYTGIDNCYRVGVPCEEIAAAAKELKSDLIIISTHNYHWFDHLMNGSDAERIVRRVSCPILVVPQDRN